MLGEVINNYVIKSLLGEGGMGAVYLAEHPFIGRRAAIKVLRRELAQDPALVERFMNEARAANAIRHPNIIDIIDVGRTPSGVPYLMMELLEGMSLAQRISEAGRLEVAEALEIGAQTCAALTAAHAKGIVHRDLKPDNLFLVPDDARPGGMKVKVLDFGIAKLRGDLTNVSAKTQAGALMGTPPYMSPEQCRGLTDDIDHRTDVYAMGIILYEMLCGAPPFVSPGWGDIVLAHLTKPPPAPRATNPGIPVEVEAAILRALTKDRSERFASMTELQAALRGAAPPVARTPAPVSAPATKPFPPATTTTFRAATGEVTAAERGAPKRARVWLGVVAAGAAAAIAIVVANGRSASVATEAAAPVAATAPPPRAPALPLPSAIPSEAARAPSPAPGAIPPGVEPAAPAQIRVRLTSVPAGASVIDARDGAVLGATPLDRRIDRAVTPLSIRIAKSGFASAELRVPRDADFDTMVRLERSRSTSSRRQPEVSTSTKAASSAPVAAPPPVRAAEPSPARRVEKW
jgi:tRNA A-37 threonylcarbamoyl transferase component Bud32